MAKKSANNVRQGPPFIPGLQKKRPDLAREGCHLGTSTQRTRTEALVQFYEDGIREDSAKAIRIRCYRKDSSSEVSAGHIRMAS